MSGRTRVTVGRTAHPMDEDHWIEWVELMVENRVYRVYLRPGMPPEAEFPFEAPSAQARAYCNLHGLWASGVSG
jgi:superoxide reductase